MEDQHVVQLGDVQITVGEDEPAKRAVEAEISEIEVVHKGRPIREYFDKWRGNIDTRYALSILKRSLGSICSLSTCQCLGMP